ncbi:MAG: helix-turn-helix domain-containing protein [Limisphaerales bacterium]
MLSCLIVARARQNLKILGNSIRKHRDQVGMSQEKLAEKADLHPVYVGKVERGEQWISLHALLRIAKALGVRVRDLVNEL